MQGDDWAWGWNLVRDVRVRGQGTRSGLTYRSTTELHDRRRPDVLRGCASSCHRVSTIKADGQAARRRPPSASRTSPIRSGSVLANCAWTGWDSIQTLDVQNRRRVRRDPHPAPTLQFKNSWRIGVGDRVPSSTSAGGAASRGSSTYHTTPGAGCLPDAAPAGHRQDVARDRRPVPAQPDLVARLRLHRTSGCDNVLERISRPDRNAPSPRQHAPLEPIVDVQEPALQIFGAQASFKF